MDFASPNIVILVLLVGSLIAVSLGIASVQAIRAASRHNRDRARICDAIEQIDSFNFENGQLDLECADLADVQSSFDRMLPRLQTKVEQLEWQSQHDSLTNLLNASSFRAVCEKLLLNDKGASRAGHLLYFDVNDFKKINDTLGHHAGDQVLVAVADRLRLVAMGFAESRLQGFVEQDQQEDFEAKMARMGGDEFAIFLPGTLEKSAVERFVQRLQRVIDEPCAVGLQTLRIKVALGIASSAAGGTSYDRLLAAADSAMYAAKSAGGHTYMFFSEEMRSNADRLLERELELRGALQDNQFELYYQPQLNLKSGRIDTVEALIRWRHPDRGLLLPGEFIGFAETHGLIDEIGDWVITEAIRTAGRWQQLGLNLKISLNVSPKQLQQVELIALIRANLDFHKVAPELIEIEITEAAIMRDEMHSFDRLESLRKDGVTIALDDFGTGYSNISQLMMLPMDRLKLDRSLIDCIGVDQRKWAIASGMISIARELGFHVVAEGVETHDQLELLQETGCDFVQGYLISRPMAEEQLIAFVQSQTYAISPERAA